jgi:hypothetical protein
MLRGYKGTHRGRPIMGSKERLGSVPLWFWYLTGAKV